MIGKARGVRHTEKPDTPMMRKLLILGTIIYFLLARNTGDQLYVFLSTYLGMLTLAVWCRGKKSPPPPKKEKEKS